MDNDKVSIHANAPKIETRYLGSLVRWKAQIRRDMCKSYRKNFPEIGND
nr:MULTISPECIES: hypothetical protein [Providencia]